MSDTEQVNVKCLCGDFQLCLDISKNQLPLKGSICHCDSCRHGSGTLYIGAAYVPEACIKTVQESLPKLKASKWSTRRMTYLCDTCGSLIVGQLDGQLWLHTGCLDRIDSILHLGRQIFVQDTVDGGFSHWLKGLSLETYATQQGELPKGWPTVDNKHIEQSSDRLHAHCLCGGINLWISRPTESSADTASPWPDLLVPWHSPFSHHYRQNTPWWLRDNRTKFLAGLCTCDSCRLSSGCDFVEWAFVPAADISLSAEGSIPFSRDFGTVKSYRSSDKATRYFCGQCGANVFWIGDERPGLLDVAVGLLDAAEGALARSWLEWRTGRISFKEDANGRAGKLVDNVEMALGEWAKTAGQSHN